MNLENMTKIYARGDSRIQLKVIPGHFVTSQSHITHYLDLTTMKSRTAEAQNIAHELAANYEVSTPVDTIICMDGLEVIGAYLSEELTKAGIFSLNAHQTIYVITPESSNSGQIIFRDNFQPMIKGKNVLILNGSITTGSTLSKAIESILYYGGTIRGIAAIFSRVDSVASLPVYSIFNTKDILVKIDDFVWGPVMLILLVGTGIFLTVRTRFLTWRNLGYALKSTLSKEARTKSRGQRDVSPFSALTTALAATIGTGNIVGVATAMVSGGPGALVWNFSDIANALMAIPNLICMLLLSGEIAKDVKEFQPEIKK